MKKTILWMIPFALLSGLGFPQQVRDWTDKESGNKIQAALIGQSPSSDEVTIRKTDGAVFRIKAARLSEADQRYIQLWLPADEKVTCEVTGKPLDGFKSVKITVKAGPEDMSIVLEKPPMEKSVFPKPDILLPFTYKIKAGEKWENTLTLPNNYKVTAYEGERVADEESFQKKTGRR